MTGKTYTKAEVDALIAAEREAALREGKERVRSLSSGNPEGAMGDQALFAALLELQALIDQPSALDEALAAAKAEGVREGMAAVDQHTFETSGGQKVIDYREFRMTCESLLAADEQN